jgi:SAM-dependent methyltransferase
VSDVTRHYERLLARHYTWYAGEIEGAAATQRALLQTLGVAGPEGTATDLAVDLGAGPGYQSFALADLGYRRVVAIDSSAELLAELAAHRPARAGIETVVGDICDELARRVQPASAAIVVCMGDTLLLLPSKAAVAALFRDVLPALAPGGVFVATYRDLTAELSGLDRFIPLRADAERIMLCFLERESAETLRVHDLIYVRGDCGWQLHKSSYPKLRLDPQWVADELAVAGLRVRRHGLLPSGVWATVAVRDRVG